MSEIAFSADISYNSRQMKPKIDIDYVCALARLKLTREEKARLAPQMLEIVEWVAKLEEMKIDVSKKNVYSPVSFSLPFRQDKIQPSFPPAKALASSPEKTKEFIKVPKVIEEK